jgi:hypothetical protein
MDELSAHNVREYRCAYQKRLSVRPRQSPKLSEISVRIEEHRMDWKFHCVPGEEYPSRYVENEAKVKIGYLGYAKQLHYFEYTRGSFGFSLKLRR